MCLPQHVRRAVLPVLAKVLGKPGALYEEAPQLLAQLVEGSAALQAAAADADAIAKLAVYLQQQECSLYLKVCPAALPVPPCLPAPTHVQEPG